MHLRERACTGAPVTDTAGAGWILHSKLLLSFFSPRNEKKKGPANAGQLIGERKIAFRLAAKPVE